MLKGEFQIGANSLWPIFLTLCNVGALCPLATVVFWGVSSMVALKTHCQDCLEELGNDFKDVKMGDDNKLNRLVLPFSWTIITCWPGLSFSGQFI